MRNGLATAVGAVVAVVALALPVAAFLHADGDDLVADRHAAPGPTLSPAELDELVAGSDASAAGAPLILSYHDVRPDPPADDRYTVTPQQLADHLAMLRAAGYESITSADLAGWLDGERRLPPRPVLLTFDDGASGVWRHADAVLEDQGFNAVAFVITSRVGTHRPYYLTWEEIERLERSGRWDIESHTRAGHDRIDVDAAGSRQPYLINLRYLADEQRLETPEELATRVRHDLEGSIEDLARHGLGRSRLFAYPFSAETNPTNDPAAPGITAGIVADLFDAGMTNVVPDRLVSERDRRRRSLPRIEVFNDTTPADLHTRITAATPTAPGPATPLTDPDAWTDSGGEPLAGAVTPDVDQGSELAELAAFDAAAGSVTLSPPRGDYLSAHHAPGVSTDWSGYTVAADVSGLGGSEAADGPTGSLFGLVGSDQQVQVAVSSTYVRVRVGRNDGTVQTVTETTLAPADARHVELSTAGGVAVVVLDGVEVARFPLTGEHTGGVGLAASGGPVTFAAMELHPGAGQLGTDR